MKNNNTMTSVRIIFEHNDISYEIIADTAKLALYEMTILKAAIQPTKYAGVDK